MESIELVDDETSKVSASPLSLGGLSLKSRMSDPDPGPTDPTGPSYSRQCRTHHLLTRYHWIPRARPAQENHVPLAFPIVGES